MNLKDVKQTKIGAYTFRYDETDDRWTINSKTMAVSAASGHILISADSARDTKVLLKVDVPNVIKWRLHIQPSREHRLALYDNFEVENT